MSETLQFEKGRAKALGGKLPPALRAFVEEVIVPALVREYLADKKSANVLASENCGVANSAASASVSCEVIQ